MTKTDTKITMADKIYFEIKKDIVAHVLVPGAKINIKELALRYEASVTPVKLALNRLVSERVIEDFPRQGMRVKSIAVQEIEEIFDVRLMLDLYHMKEIIATVGYNAKLAEAFEHNLKAQMELNNRLTKESEVEDFIRKYELDDAFHQMYLKCTGNRKMVELYNSLNPFLYSTYIYRLQSKQKDTAGVEEHQAIVSAILDRDEEALRAAVTAHIVNAKNSVGLLLKVQEFL